MWGKQDDFIGKEAFGDGEMKPRELQKPGTFYEYNDVRINRFALSLLRVFKKPVPDVFRDEVMDLDRRLEHVAAGCRITTATSTSTAGSWRR